MELSAGEIDMLSEYQKEFVQFLLRKEVLQFGAFRTKSGRDTPYFINTGKLNTGESIAKLGSFYAAHIKANMPVLPNVIFGPAYKGIPLAVATSEGLHREFGIQSFYSFDRKEAKDHGDKGIYVGRTPADGDRIVIVEDVVTAGTTLRSVVPTLLSAAKIELSGVVISVDRCEVGSGTVSAVDEMRQLLDIKIFPVLTIHQIVQYLSSEEAGTDRLSADSLSAIQKYLETYGAKN